MERGTGKERTLIQFCTGIAWPPKVGHCVGKFFPGFYTNPPCCSLSSLNSTEMETSQPLSME